MPKTAVEIPITRRYGKGGFGVGVLVGLDRAEMVRVVAVASPRMLAGRDRTTIYINAGNLSARGESDGGRSGDVFFLYIHHLIIHTQTGHNGSKESHSRRSLPRNLH